MAFCATESPLASTKQALNSLKQQSKLWTPKKKDSSGICVELLWSFLLLEAKEPPFARMVLIIRRLIDLSSVTLLVMKPKHPQLIRLGQNIRALRKQKGFSQEAFAFEAELDRTYIGGIERGERNVSLLNICRIARALDVSPAILLDGVGYGEQSKGQK